MPRDPETTPLVSNVPQELGESPQARGTMKIQTDTQLSSCLKTNTQNHRRSELSWELLAQWAQQGSPRKVHKAPQEDRVRGHPDGPRRPVEGTLSEPRLFPPKEGKEKPQQPKS